MSARLWRGDDGSMIVVDRVEPELQIDGVNVVAACRVYFMPDGRVITYEPAPLCLPRPQDHESSDL